MVPDGPVPLKVDDLCVGRADGSVKFVHPAEPGPMIEAPGGQAAGFDAGSAGPKRHPRIGGD